MLRAGTPPAATGTLEEGPDEIFVTVARSVKRGLAETVAVLDGRAAIAYDAENLYLAMQVRDDSAMLNSAQDPKNLFKRGDAADVTIGLDPAADPTRQDAVAGDLRLLFAMIAGKPVVTLYKPVDPESPADARTTFESPVARIHLDRVQKVRGAKVAVTTDRQPKTRDGVVVEGTYWTLEAAVSWADIGVAPPEPGAVIRGDFGYLQSDGNGTSTVGRRYWSEAGQTAVTDTPSEARLCPAVWGESSS